MSALNGGGYAAGSKGTVEINSISSKDILGLAGASVGSGKFQIQNQ